MEFTEGQEVSLRIQSETNLGFTVTIDGVAEGLLYRNEVFQDLEEGMQVTGYIKSIREDGKIDVSLRPQGYRNVVDEDAAMILQKLKESRGGFLLLTDKSSPEAIKFQLQMSKKAFKKAIGKLYKERRITLESDRIVLKG